MSALAHAAQHTFRDYLALEASGNVKHEYYAGEIGCVAGSGGTRARPRGDRPARGRIYAMAGGTPLHAALQVAVPSLLFPQIRHGTCRAHGADLRVRVLATGLATYPDVTVVCGPRELDPEDANTVVNPTLLVEVLSPSTAEYDRGRQAVSPEAPRMTKACGATGRLATKLENYKLIPSLRQYVLVSSDERKIEVWTRDAADVWTLVTSLPGGVAELPAIGARLSVDELYDAAGAPA